MTQIKTTFILFSLLMMTACGYHLRGNVELPKALKAVYLQNGSEDLRRSFKKTLKYIDGKLVGTREAAGLIVQVLKERMDRRVLSLSNTGRVNEEELVYTLHFRMFDKKGKPLKEVQEIEIRRDFFNDQGDVLAKNNENETIRIEMYDQAVLSIAQRARAILDDK
ncbi:MAG: hypothetical protein KAH20_12845 [Methylococcales bacterium]|nr:hypothetical protein [Methylococcales bacterium]